MRTWNEILSLARSTDDFVEYRSIFPFFGVSFGAVIELLCEMYLKHHEHIHLVWYLVPVA